MKKEFYLDFSKPDVERDYFSRAASESASSQILNMPIFDGETESKNIGKVIKSEFLTDETIRVIVEIDEAVSVEPNAAITLNYFVDDYVMKGNFREVTDLTAKKLFLLKDKSEIEMYRNKMA